MHANDKFKPKDLDKLKEILSKKNDLKSSKNDIYDIKSKIFKKFDCKIKKSKALEQQIRSEKLRLSCNKTLNTSEFRSINEYLYSNFSVEGFIYLRNKERFLKYHRSYKDLVKKWPVKPIDVISNEIIAIYGYKKLRKIVIADMGCGDLPQLKIKFPKSIVHSYDAFSCHPDIISCNIQKVPLENKSCDCVVFSLSLMAKNISDLILEANRILKLKGILMIAEVVSRFQTTTLDEFAKIINQYGFMASEKKLLPPNSYFVLMSFVKKHDVCKIEIQKKNVPVISLKPCFYKPR